MQRRFVLVFCAILLIGLSALAGAEPRRVAVVDFDDRTGQGLAGIGDTAGEILGISLAKSGLFEVVERAKLDRIMEEHALSVSGLVDSEKNMLALGKLLNANSIITGSVLEFSKRVQTITAYNVTTTKAVFHLEVSVKELEINTAKICFADIFDADHEVLVTGNTSLTMTEITRQLLKLALAKAAEAMVAAEKVRNQPVATEAEVMVAFGSDPDGCDVVIDGIYVGATPLDVPVKEGVHLIKISRSGYIPWENKVRVYSGMKPIFVTLAPQPPPVQ